jgi:hypothetical protein
VFLILEDLTFVSKCCPIVFTAEIAKKARNIN